MSGEVTVTSETVITEVQRRKLEVKREKYAKIKTFFITKDRFPSNRSEDEEERYLGQFFINRKAAKKQEELEQWEIETIDVLQSMYENGKTKNSRMARLLSILTYCELNNKTPSQSSENPYEQSLGRKLNTLKISESEFDEKEKLVFDKIMEHKSRYLTPRFEKLQEVLTFCKKNKTTPRQHSVDADEKRMADFLSSTKSYMKKNKLTPNEEIEYNNILEYTKPSKNEKMNALVVFCEKNKKTPKINSSDEHERKLAVFFTRTKVQYSKKKLFGDLKESFKSILQVCNIKTRMEKLTTLKEYVTEINRFPILDSNNDTERQMAIFLNNAKQLKRNEKLDSAELVLLDSVLRMFV